VEAGIYANLKAKSGCSAPWLLGTSRPESVGHAVVDAIERDRVEVIVNPLPARPLVALNALSPRLGAWVTDKIGANDFFCRVAAGLERDRLQASGKGDAL
jgi:hypothetical protein